MTSGLALIEEINACQVAPGSVTFWWLGQLGYAVKVANLVLYLDAFLEPMKRRQVPPLLEPAQVTNANWVFGTHDHGDHIDPVAFPGIALASPQARFVCPRSAVPRVRALGIDGSRILAMDEGLVYDDPAQHLRIEAVAAAHEFLDYSPETG
ncbi:MAG: MBL fold metallo-hydrolase, partial [Anaerolineae bacterium]